KKLLLLTLSVIFLISCSSDDDGNQPEPGPPGAYENGILVTNEGPFVNGTGTVSFISEDFSMVNQEIYRTVNGRDLGNIVQSMGFQDDNAYIVVNNSQKIQVV